MNYFLTLAAIALFCVAGQRDCMAGQTATFHFRTTTAVAYDKLQPRIAVVRETLLKDGLFADAKDRDPLWDERPKFVGWILIGEKKPRFEGITVVYTPERFGPRKIASIWIRFHFDSLELKSEKIEALKAMISAAIGPEVMRDVETSVTFVPLFPNVR